MQDISADQVCYIVVKTREYQAKVAPVEPDPASNPADDSEREILEDYAGDPTYAELAEALRDLNADQRAEIVVLAWIGRGDFTRADWDEAIDGAQEVIGQRFVRYMTGMPLLADYLEAGLAEFDESCEEFEAGRL